MCAEVLGLDAHNSVMERSLILFPFFGLYCHCGYGSAYSEFGHSPVEINWTLYLFSLSIKDFLII